MEKGVEFADATSKMAFFMTLINVWELLTNGINITKSSISDAAGVLDTPVFMYKYIYVNYEYFKAKTYTEVFLSNIYTCG